MYITVNKTPAISGFFAILMWEAPDEGFGPYWEPYETGIGRYATYEEAVVEARQWADDQDIELRL